MIYNCNFRSGKVLPDHKTLAGLGTGQPRIADIPEKEENKI
jgi:hypothetical protein